MKIISDDGEVIVDLEKIDKFGYSHFHEKDELTLVFNDETKSITYRGDFAFRLYKILKRLKIKT